MPDLSESIAVSAPAADLYALISDLPRMGEWSPECTRVTWRGRPPYAAGSRFIGHNRIGAIRWISQGVVTEAEPGRRFTFHIYFGPLPVADWSYELAATPDGACTVTESWTDRRPRALRHALSAVYGQRVPLNQQGIHTTLANLKTAAESGVR
ncbi:SRPBCC family protein [Kribbella sp. DT2]|uniref:SRPBCC family protein n=1 Tax=Kribbella sp. DT2 TaxID=3393427 RepID=UPI003CFA706E